MDRSNGSSSVVLVTTRGPGSMDRYGRLLARSLPVPALELDLGRTSAGAFDVALASSASFRGLATDAGLVRALRRLRAPVHLTNHHLGRYGPFLCAPYVVTAHDLIRWFDVEHRTGYISRSNRRDRICIRRDYAGIRRATAIVAPSEATRRDLVDHLRVPEERVFVVHEGIEHDRFRPVERRPVETPYVLFVGSEHPRKNLAGLLRAFARLKREPRFRELRLVKVGAAGSGERPFRVATVALARELGLKRDVDLVGEVPDAELPAYYSGAACLVLPSLYEGFGLPPLEAMACGCPAIVSDAGALPEVAGGAALVLPPRDVGALARAMRQLLTDGAAAAELRARGLERARAFTWKRAARETMRVYEAALDRPRERRRWLTAGAEPRGSRAAASAYSRR